MITKHNMNLALADPSVCSVATSAPAAQRRQFQQLSSRLVGLLATWKFRQKTRNHLAYATPEVLRDVGISEAQRFIEVNKSFWEA